LIHFLSACYDSAADLASALDTDPDRDHDSDPDPDTDSDTDSDHLARKID